MPPSIQATNDQPSSSIQAEELGTIYHLGTPQQEYGIQYTKMMLTCGIASRF